MIDLRTMFKNKSSDDLLDTAFIIINFYWHPIKNQLIPCFTAYIENFIIFKRVKSVYVDYPIYYIIQIIIC
jgi:hypothetical protein